MDFKRLANKKLPTQQYGNSTHDSDKSSKCPKKNPENLLDILNGAKDDSSDESNTEVCICEGNLNCLYYINNFRRTQMLVQKRNFWQFEIMNSSNN